MAYDFSRERERYINSVRAAQRADPSVCENEGYQLLCREFEGNLRDNLLSDHPQLAAEVSDDRASGTRPGNHLFVPTLTFRTPIANNR